MAKSTENKEYTMLKVRDRDGKVYTLQFNRRGVEAMERAGFKFDMDNAPNTSMRDLFRGAFRMNHKGITPEKVDDIWDYQTQKEKLIPILYRLYLQPLEDLMSEPEDADNENPTWETA